MTKVFRLSSAPTIKRMLISGVLGTWLHVALDAPLYRDIRPFWPLSANPLLGTIGSDALYAFCAWSFIPALVIYAVMVIRTRDSERDT